MCIITLILGGTIGIILKLKVPYMKAYANSFRFNLLEWSKFNVILAHGINLSHLESRKLGLALAKLDLK